MRFRVLAIIVSAGFFLTSSAAAQTETPKSDQKPAATAGSAQSPQPMPATQVGNQPANNKPAAKNDGADVPADFQAKRIQLTPEDMVGSYYNNFFTNYRLGPEDVISVTVFNQERYSRSGVVIPPSGRIALSLIPNGIFVNGKTVDEVSELIKKQYDEYLIDPQVTVSLDKAASYHYSVIGDVGQPGVRVMTRRLTVSEAIAEAGGVLPTGNRSRVTLLRRQSDGTMYSIPVNVSAVYKGKEPDNHYLLPGDQIVVPGNKLKTVQKIMAYGSVLSFARIFMGGLPF